MRQTGCTLWFLIVICFLIACGPSITENDIRKRIDSAIPIGSAKNDVVRFLDANSFDVIIDPRGVRPPNDREVDWITASFEQRVLFKHHYIVVDFFFDKNAGSLTEYKIRSFYEGPGT